MNRRTQSFLPSPVDVLFIGIVLPLVLNPRKLLLDGDTGYHIRAGEYILDHRVVPKTDIFSHWEPALAWTAHEWLAEIIMALAHDALDLAGVVILFSVFIALTYVGLFYFLRRFQASVLLALLLASMTAFVSSIHWLARPHIFTLALTVAWYYVLSRFQYEGRNYLYALPIMTILWVNLHGGFIFGLILVIVYIGGNLIEAFLNDGSGRPGHLRKTLVLSAALGGCLLASLLNPHGYRILLFPFELTFDTFIVAHVQEFLSPNFQQALPFKYLLLATIALLAVSKTNLNWIELGLLMLVTHMALYSARHIPLYAIIAAPIIARLLRGFSLELPYGALTLLRRRHENFRFVVQRAKGCFWSMTTITAIVVLAFFKILRADFDHMVFPHAAVEFLKLERIRGNMFNNDEFGDYLIYTAWPEYKVFFDGRSDMYGSGLGREYLRVARTLPGWEHVLDKHRVDWIFFNTRSALSWQLRKHPQWRPIYSDAVASIFVRNEAHFNDLIVKYSSNVRFIQR